MVVLVWGCLRPLRPGPPWCFGGVCRLPWGVPFVVGFADGSGRAVRLRPASLAAFAPPHYVVLRRVAYVGCRLLFEPASYQLAVYTHVGKTKSATNKLGSSIPPLDPTLICLDLMCTVVAQGFASYARLEAFRGQSKFLRSVSACDAFLL
jgi:hypothetical protein